MIHKVLFPSSELHSVVHHYEYFKIDSSTTPKEGYLDLPSFASGFCFCFYRGSPFLTSSENLKDFPFPEDTLTVPILNPAHHRQVSDVNVLRVLFQPGVLSDIYTLSFKEARIEPMSMRYNLHPELEDIYDQLAHRVDPLQQIEVIEKYLLKKLRFKSPDSSLILYLHQFLSQEGYSNSVESIAEKIGYSSRHLNRLIIKKSGFNVSEFIRVHRFHRALEFLHRQEFHSLTQIAYQLGYYDQSHFIREFKMMSHMTPTAYLKSLGLKVLSTESPNDFEYAGFQVPKNY